MTDPRRSIRPQDETADDAAIRDPGKLIRLGSMVAATLNEVRDVDLDEQGRRQLQELHLRTVEELKDLMPDVLRSELDEEVVLPLEDGTASEAELRVAQARMIGWLEGLFRGLQATAVSQQMAGQLEQLRRGQERGEAPGQYL